MREQFKVDLRGIVDILSHHLYSSERVYLRELLQNARDAIQARSRTDSSYVGAVDVRPARNGEPMTVRDNGIGLTAEEMGTLLATIGGSSKRGDFAFQRSRFLGQFGIGLLSCFLVADTIEVRSRSAREPDAPTIHWVGHADGTYSIDEAAEPLDSPGTEVQIMPRHGDHDWCSEEMVLRLAREFAEHLEVVVRVNGQLVSQTTPPWDLPTEEQIAWCRDRLGFEPMGIIALSSALLDVQGLGFVLPYSAQPGHRTGDRVYSNGMLVADSYDQLLPEWAFFCRAVIDAGELTLTASREALQETTSLGVVRDNLGSALLRELVMVQGMHPRVYEEIVQLHAVGLKALAISSIDMRDLLRSTLPFRTTEGEATIEELLERPAPVPYVTSADTFEALGDVALHAGTLVIDASGPHDQELLQSINETDGEHFVEVAAKDVPAIAKPRPMDDAEGAERLRAVAESSLDNVDVQVSHFEPAARPVLWWPSTESGAAGNLVLNANAAVVQGLLKDPDRAEVADTVRALHVVGLLLARATVTVDQAHVLASAVSTLSADGS